MTQVDLERVAQGYEAFNRREYEAIVPLLDDGIVYRMPMDPLDRHPVFRGHDGVREFYGLLADGFAEFRAEIDSIHEHGEVISVTGRMIARTHAAPDETVVTRFAHFWRVRDGHAVEVSFHDADNPFTLLEGSAEQGAGDESGHMGHERDAPSGALGGD